ncbi:MAG: hypothetical protein PHV30_10250 [Candidatus Margulisbacteria bacterium]|nr:hypothetical protein [Candidatus Margulisiibacteriota bacterium]
MKNKIIALSVNEAVDLATKNSLKFVPSSLIFPTESAISKNKLNDIERFYLSGKAILYTPIVVIRDINKPDKFYAVDGNHRLIVVKRIQFKHILVLELPVHGFEISSLGRSLYVQNQNLVDFFIETALRKDTIIQISKDEKINRGLTTFQWNGSRYQFAANLGKVAQHEIMSDFIRTLEKQGVDTEKMAVSRADIFKLFKQNIPSNLVVSQAGFSKNELLSLAREGTIFPPKSILVNFTGNVKRTTIPIRISRASMDCDLEGLNRKLQQELDTLNFLSLPWLINVGGRHTTPAQTVPILKDSPEDFAFELIHHEEIGQIDLSEPQVITKY